jgi:acyl carrier protein
MALKTVLALLGGVVVVIALVRLHSLRRARKIEAAFAGREAFAAEEFYDKHFRALGVPLEVVVGVRSILEEQLSADLSRLRGTDDFSKNLSFFWDFDSLADVQIVCALEERFGIKISDEEAQHAKTVAEIVHLVQRKITCNAI